MGLFNFDENSFFYIIKPMLNRLLAIILFVSLAFTAGAGAQTVIQTGAWQVGAQAAPADSSQASEALDAEENVALDPESAEVPDSVVAGDPLVKARPV